MFLKKISVPNAFIIGFSAIMLSACSATETTQSTARATKPEVPTKQHAESIRIAAEPNLTSKQRMSKAIRSLEQGASDIAEAELLEYQKSVPNSRRAEVLLKQIQTAPEDYFPTEYFSLTLRSGQSLSTLAKKYLGSAWDFYALAKYNQIENPSRVNIGNEIKIPLTQLAQRVKNQEQQDIKLAEARLLTKQATESKEDVALNIEEPTLSAATNDITEFTPNELVAKLENANLTKDFTESDIYLTELETRDNLSSDIQERLKKSKLIYLAEHAEALLDDNPQQASLLWLEHGEMKLLEDKSLEALRSFKSAFLADESNTFTKQKFTDLKNSITQKYHREASTLFRQQALDEAIEKWNIVLEVDPGHSNALAYRTQAIELKQRLEALNKQ